MNIFQLFFPGQVSDNDINEKYADMHNREKLVTNLTGDPLFKLVKEKVFREQHSELIGQTINLDDDAIVDYYLTQTESIEYARLNADTNQIESIQVDYPKFFLHLRGHNIHEAIESLVSEETKKLKNFVFNRLKLISCTNNEDEFKGVCLPSDMTDIIYDLNKMVRVQCNKIVKPKKTP